MISPLDANLIVVVEAVEKDAEVIAIHPCMPMSNRLVTTNDFVLADFEVDFVVGITLRELQTKEFQSLIAVSTKFPYFVLLFVFFTFSNPCLLCVVEFPIFFADVHQDGQLRQKGQGDHKGAQTRHN